MSLVDKIFIYEVPDNAAAAAAAARPAPHQKTWNVRFEINDRPGPQSHVIVEPSYRYDFNDYVTESAHVLARARINSPPAREHPDLPYWNDGVSVYATDLLAQLPFEQFKEQHGIFSANARGCVIYVIEEHKKNIRRGRGLHSIKWELLEGHSLNELCQHPYTIAVSRVIDFKGGVRRPHPDPLLAIQKKENETVKILLVIARNLKKQGRNKDADPDLAQRPLMQLQHDLNRARTRIMVEIVRPGSKQKLREHLAFRASQDVHFNIIHFDLHGADANTSDKSESRLIFTESDKEKDPSGVFAEKAADVAKIIEEFRIEHVVMTACWSAYECAGRANNMAQHFIRANVRGVSAVWGRAGTDSVLAHNEAFYRALLAANGQFSFEAAAHQGRRALRDNPSRWPSKRQYRDDFLYVYYARDNPSVRHREARRLADILRACNRVLAQVPPILRRRHQQNSQQPGKLEYIPRLDLISLELEVYLQTHRLVYASNSFDKQPELTRFIQGLSHLWLCTNFVQQVSFYNIELSNRGPTQGIPPPHVTLPRHTHGYAWGHRLPDALGGTVHVFKGLDNVFQGVFTGSDVHGPSRETIIRKMREFLLDMSKRDYAIIIGCNGELEWMPKEWANDPPKTPRGSGGRLHSLTTHLCITFPLAVRFGCDWLGPAERDSAKDLFGSAINPWEEGFLQFPSLAVHFSPNNQNAKALLPSDDRAIDERSKSGEQNLGYCVALPMAEVRLSFVVDKLRRVRTALKHEFISESGPSRLDIVYKSEIPTIDIIAVHGLARGFKTWTWGNNTLNRPNWLEAGLAEDCGKQARIMTYSYEPDLFKSQAHVRTVLYSRAHDLIHKIAALREGDNTSNRPLVFVAHSLGGLIVKRALIYSTESPDSNIRRVEVLTGGIAFFGTPDDDIKPSSLADIIRNVSHLSLDPDSWLKSNEKQLINDAHWLQNELGSYKPIRSGLKILSVYETKATSFRGRKALIVNGPEPFKRLGDTYISLQRNHTGLVKFNGKEDQDYVKFERLFGELLTESKPRAAEKLLKYEPVMKPLKGKTIANVEKNFCILPYSSGPSTRQPYDSVIRHEFITRIQQYFEVPRSIKDFAIVTVYGPPGVGKTTLVRDYGEQLVDKGRSVFWMNAESRHTVITGYLHLLKVIVDYYAETYHTNQFPNPADARAQVERDMGIPSPHAMLDKGSIDLLDPVEVQSAIKVFDNVRPSYNLLEFIPLSKHGQLVLISEERSYCPFGEAIEIHAWANDEAIELFNKLMETPQPIHGHTPMVQNPLLSENISKKIVTELGSNPPLTIQVLRVCTILSSNAFPYSLLEMIADRCSHNYGGSSGAGTLAKIVEDLESQSIILRVAEPNASTTTPPERIGGARDSYILHQNAKEWIKGSWIKNEQEELRSAWTASYCCTRFIRHHSYTPVVLEAQLSERIIVPHAKACYDMSDRINENIHNLWDDRTDNRSAIEWQVLGGVFMRQGLRKEAIKCFKLALAKPEEMRAREQIETRLNLISLYQQAGKITKCREQLEQINIDEINLKDRALSRRVELAKAIEAVATGELETATEHYKSLDKYQEEDFGPVDTRTIFTVHRLGATLKHLGRLDDAEAKYKQALLSYKIVLGINNSVTLDAAEELAQILQLRGTFARAQELFEWTTDIKRKTLGKQHPSTAISIAKHAALCDVKGDFVGADEKYKEAFDIMSQSLGRSHPIYLATLENQALSYRKRAQQLFTQEQQRSEQRSEVKEQYGRHYQQAEAIFCDVIDQKLLNPEFHNEDSIRGTRKKLAKMYEAEKYFTNATGNRRLGYLSDISGNIIAGSI
ncbi:hypothetical protein SCUP234_08342 [Seiridium cupressi]